MAANFVLENISIDNFNTLRETNHINVIHTVMHANVAWNPASRALMQTYLAGQPLPNGTRAGLPPHVYVEFGGDANIQRRIDDWDWLDAMIINQHQGGTRTLHKDALYQYNNGRLLNRHAVAMQARKQSVRLGFFKIGDREVTTAIFAHLLQHGALPPNN